MFCEIGLAWPCVTDYRKHIAPMSPQKHRLGSATLSELIINQAFKLAQYSQVVPMFLFRRIWCSRLTPVPPEREAAWVDGKRELRQLTDSLSIAAISVGCDVGLEPTTPRTTI